MSNYPDDIDQYSNDPRSPEYRDDGPYCPECGGDMVKTMDDVFICLDPDCSGEIAPIHDWDR